MVFTGNSSLRSTVVFQSDDHPNRCRKFVIYYIKNPLMPNEVRRLSVRELRTHTYDLWISHKSQYIWSSPLSDCRQTIIYCLSSTMVEKFSRVNTVKHFFRVSKINVILCLLCPGNPQPTRCYIALKYNFDIFAHIRHTRVTKFF